MLFDAWPTQYGQHAQHHQRAFKRLKLNRLPSVHHPRHQGLLRPVVAKE